MDTWNVLSDIVILLAGALLVGGLFSRFGQSPLVGYLLAGMILGGPGSIHAVKSEKEIETIAELGVALLLFSIGLEFSINRLKKVGGKALLAGVFQVVFTLAACGGLALAYGLSINESVAVGAMLALSSTAVVLRTMTESGDIESPHGRNSLAVLLVQDIAVVPLAILIGVLAGGEGVNVAANLGKTLGMAVLLMAGLYILLNFVAVKALGTLTLERNRELTVVLAIVTGLGSTWAAHAIGISPALGAFIAGMFLGNSPFATQIRADVSSLRVVLLTIFFGAAGMVADPVWIITNAGTVFIATAIVLVVKLAVVWVIFKTTGQSTNTSATSGVCLAQVGEFAFVLGAVAMSSGVISQETEMLAVSITIVSLLISPFMLKHADFIGKKLAGFVRASPTTTETEKHQSEAPAAIIIGFGPAGQLAAMAFEELPEAVTIVDLNQDGVLHAKELGFAAEIGDASQYDVLEHLHLEATPLIVLTIPHTSTGLAILKAIRRKAPNSHVVVRSRYQRDVDELKQAGADAVFGDEQEVGRRLFEYIRDWKTGTQSNQAS